MMLCDVFMSAWTVHKPPKIVRLELTICAKFHFDRLGQRTRNKIRDGCGGATIQRSQGGSRVQSLTQPLVLPHVRV